MKIIAPTNGRRNFLTQTGVALCTLGQAMTPSNSQAKESYSDPDAADKWLLPILSAPGAVSGALHLGRFRDRIYYLDKNISWTPGPGQKGPAITVPKGFVTDLASIPRVFWSLLPSDGAYTFPAIVHDYMYWTQLHPREIADDVFKYGMDDMKISPTVSAAIYSAIRIGGQSAWNENKKLKDAGEKRLLIQFPDNPLTTWTEWKQKKDCCSKI